MPPPGHQPGILRNCWQLQGKSAPFPPAVPTRAVGARVHDGLMGSQASNCLAKIA